MADETTQASDNDVQTQLHEQTGGMAGQGGKVQSEDKRRPYEGNTLYYLCWGGFIGLIVGWLIGLGAGMNWYGGAICGIVLGAAIGLYVVETKRF